MLPCRTPQESSRDFDIAYFNLYKLLTRICLRKAIKHDPRAHLWWFEGVIGGEVNGQKEYATLVWTVILEWTENITGLFVMKTKVICQGKIGLHLEWTMPNTASLQWFEQLGIFGVQPGFSCACKICGT